MAKHNCAICGAEIGLLTEQKLADGNFICRKVCAKKGFKVFDLVSADLDSVKAHHEQVEFGTKVWNQIFVPMLNTGIPTVSPTILSWSTAAGLYTSQATSKGFLLFCLYIFAIFSKVS